MIQPQPSGASPYLCPDELIDLTRGSRKSQTSLGSTNGAKNPPGYAGRIDVNWDVQSRALLQGIERGGDLLHGLVLQREGETERRHHADRIFVAALDDLFGREEQPAALDGNFPQLDVEIAGEFVPADLHRAGDQIRAIGRLAGAVAPFAPLPLEGQAAEHGRFTRTGRRAADRGLEIGSIPQVGQHVHTARFDLGCLRILLLVDHVFVDAVVHQLANFGLDPRLAERRQVLPGVAVEEQFVVKRSVNLVARSLLLGEPVSRQGRAENGRGIDVVPNPCADADRTSARDAGALCFLLSA